MYLMQSAGKRTHLTIGFVFAPDWLKNTGTVQLCRELSGKKKDSQTFANGHLPCGRTPLVSGHLPLHSVNFLATYKHYIFNLHKRTPEAVRLREVRL